MAWSTGLPEPPGPMAAAARRMVPPRRRSGDRRDPVTLRRSSFVSSYYYHDTACAGDKDYAATHLCVATRRRRRFDAADADARHGLPVRRCRIERVTPEDRSGVDTAKVRTAGSFEVTPPFLQVRRAFKFCATYGGPPLTHTVPARAAFLSRTASCTAARSGPLESWCQWPTHRSRRTRKISRRRSEPLPLALRRPPPHLSAYGVLQARARACVVLSTVRGRSIMIGF
jgi:hypothetical protein